MTAPLYKSSAAPLLTEHALDVAYVRFLGARFEGLRLARERRLAGVSQGQLAAYLNCSASTVGNIERGERRMDPEEVAIAARALDIPISAIRISSNGNGAS